MRTEKEMFKLILDVAENDDRVRAVCMNGSRANPNAKKDSFQDYDIVYIVKDYKSFLKDHSWVDIFGEKIIMQMPETMGDNALKNSDRFAYLMLFKDKNRIDLTILPKEGLDEYIKEDQMIVKLLDKDNIIPKLPEASDKSHHIKKPTQKQFLDCLNEFWWVSTYVIKGIKRNEILYSSEHIEKYVRPMLLKVISWEVASENDYSITVGKCYKYLEDLVDPSDFKLLISTYNNSDYNACKNSLNTMINLMSKYAKVFAQKNEFIYNGEEERNVIEYIETVNGYLGSRVEW